MQHTYLTGVILAGGKASRMGGCDKGLLTLNGKPLWEHVTARLAHQVDTLAVSANRHSEHYAVSGYPVIGDTLTGFQGPLAGMLAVMQALPSEWYLFCPCDTPDIPCNLAGQFFRAKENAPAVWASDNERDHPAIVLMHHSLTGPLHDWLSASERRVLAFLRQAGGRRVRFAEAAPFANVNTPEELQRRQAQP